MTASTTLIGNVTRDPELRYSQAGTAQCNFSVAVNRRWQKNGEWQEQTSFLNVCCWQQLAENVSESVKKGDRVVVTGRLEQRSWETPEGEKRSVVEVVADDVGPSLRWATCEVRKAERREPTEALASLGATAYDEREPF